MAASDKTPGPIRCSRCFREYTPGYLPALYCPDCSQKLSAGCLSIAFLVLIVIAAAHVFSRGM